jgi:hypothetical protein
MEKSGIPEIGIGGSRGRDAQDVGAADFADLMVNGELNRWLARRPP